MDDDGDLQALFDLAADYVGAIVSSDSHLLPRQLLLHLYGLYKQAVEGDCRTHRPRFWQFGANKKWNAWHSVIGTSQQDAMAQYVQLLTQSHPQWLASVGSKGASGGGAKMGPVFSSLARAEDAAASDPTKANLHEAAGQGDVAQLERLLLRPGVDVNARDDTGCSPLHFAADRGEPKTLQLLMSEGADVNARDDDGLTPLHYAAMCEHQQLCVQLLQAGALIQEDASGQTPADVSPASWDIWP